MAPASKTKGEGWAKYGPNQRTRPMDQYPEIYVDIVKKALQNGLVPALRHFNGRVLRVATMCSGTDAPIIALRMIQKALRTFTDIKLEFVHEFSAEIDPKRQAFIVRNCPSVPMIFRDVMELAVPGFSPTTAYGKSVSPSDVPSSIDMLVAGYVCKDFSSLNQNRKKLEDVGQSTSTLRAIIGYCQLHHPTLVILENVETPEWDKVIDLIHREVSYSARYVKVDTKKFYIPQTRQRRYAIMVNQERAGGPNKARQITIAWAALMERFERPASSPFDAFILQRDDPMVRRGNLGVRANNRTKETEWTASRLRHLRTRRQYHLGVGRPITHWSEAGRLELDDYFDRNFFNPQPYRINDCIDINCLKKLAGGIDIRYKTRYIDVSQNVDFFHESERFGWIGCLTPRGLHFSTMRGGQITGLEYLAAQGLPVWEIIITSETDADLKQMAGNAMTTTIVGAAMLSALICAFPIMAPGRSRLIPVSIAEESSIEMNFHQLHHEKAFSCFTSNVQLIAADFTTACNSVRKCHCEGQDHISSRAINECVVCNHTACQGCSGSPSHHYSSRTIKPEGRIQPSKFREHIRQKLPMRLYLGNFNVRSLLRSLQSHKSTVKGDGWELLMECLKISLDQELRYESERRSHEWTIVYKGVSSRLELKINDGQAVWYLFVEPLKSLASGDRYHQFLDLPIARMYPKSMNDIMTGVWQLRIDSWHTRFDISIIGKGPLTRSWLARQGLKGLQDVGKHVWRFLTVRVNGKPTLQSAQDSTYLQFERNENNVYLDKDIDGTYELVQDCGTSFGSLHRKITKEDSTEEPIFLFHDPDPYGSPAKDSYVFASSAHRLNYRERRHIIARLNPSWKPSAIQQSVVDCENQGNWLNTEARLMQMPGTDRAWSRTVKADLHKFVESSVANQSCSSSMIAVLQCEVPLRQKDLAGWQPGPWQTVSAVEMRRTMKTFTWLLERVKTLDSFPFEWRELQIPDGLSRCTECAPNNPGLLWRREVRGKRSIIIPEEDPMSAADFERVMQSRSSPISIQTMQENRDRTWYGLLQIGINIPTLAHRALAKLNQQANDLPIRAWWSLETQYRHRIKPKLSHFTLKDNNRYKPLSYTFPKHQTLKQTQTKSFRWMVQREEMPSYFMEREIEEAVLYELGWRAAVLVRRRCGSRGGALMDKVGYGKTVLILALIAWRKRADEEHARSDCGDHLHSFRNLYPKAKPRILPKKVELQCKGHIPIKATLIVLQHSLVRQWKDQISMFLGTGYKVMTIVDMKKMRQASVREYEEADIILVNWGVLNHDDYLDIMSCFGATPEGPTHAGRAFDTWLEHAYKATMRCVDILRNTDDFEEYAADLQNELTYNENDPTLKRRTASKKQKGKAPLPKSNRNQSGQAIQTSSGDGEGDEVVHQPEMIDISAEEETLTKKWAPRKAKISDFNFKSAKTTGDLRGVPLNVFCFARIVTDEFANAPEKVPSIVAALQSVSKWVLSATPELDAFSDVQRVAKFLGVYLGIDHDSVESMSAKDLRMFRQERTSAERFQSLVHLPSSTWHEERHRHAQSFLDKFARHNDFILDGVPSCANNLLVLDLLPLERTMYMEVQQQLMGQDMKIIKANRSQAESDRAQRMESILQGCQSGEEALIQAATIFRHSIREGTAYSSDNVYSQMVDNRNDHCKNLRKLFSKMFPWAGQLYKYLVNNYDKKKIHHYRDLKSFLHDGLFEDAEAIQDVIKIQLNAPRNIRSAPQDLRTYQNNEAINTALRNLVLELHATIAEYIAGYRAKRYLLNTRALQILKARGQRIPTYRCDACGGLQSLKILVVLGLCGHVVCDICLSSPERSGRCVVEGCEASAGDSYMHRVENLGAHAPSMTWEGSKIDTIVTIIRLKVAVEEQVLIFVQNDSLGRQVLAALERARISCLSLLGTKSSKAACGFQTVPSKEIAKHLEQFQKTPCPGKDFSPIPARHDRMGDKYKRCLIINAFSEAAAGANLTNANHVMFVSPLYAESQNRYEAILKQCVGRALRYLQTQPVHIWKFVVLNTIDVDTLQMRKSSRLLRVGQNEDFEKNTWILKNENDLNEEEKKQQWGTGYERVRKDYEFL